MKTFVRAALLILLAAAIVFGTAWYLLEYDTDFTHDALLYGAQYFEEKDQPGISTFLYNLAYRYGQSIDEISIELAEYYQSVGNYAKVESTLKRAIEDGAGIEVYIALSKAFIAQNKLKDAMDLVDGVTDPGLRSKLELLRPAAPTPSMAGGNYNEYISVSFQSDSGSIYVSANVEIPSLESHLYSAPIELGSGKTALYAMAVGESGLVSPVTKSEYVIFGVIEPVTFADEKIEEALRELISIPYGVTVYTDDLWAVRSFEVPEDALTLSDLKYLPYLETLTISGNATSLAPVRDLEHLTRLYISDTFVDSQTLQAILSRTGMKELTLRNCSLTSLNGFEQLTALTHLNISNNALTDLTPLSGIIGMQVLSINHCAVVNLDALENMTALQELDLSFNSIKDVSPLSGLDKLEKLNLSTNQISNLRPLNKLTRLKNLDLSHNKITTVQHLSTCPALQELNLSNNSLTGINALANLITLERLDISNNKITTFPSFSRKCALAIIEASNNKISSIYPLAGVDNLNSINLDYNPRLSNISDLADCTKLVSVSVFGTRVKDVSALTEQGIIVYYDPT